MTNVPYRSSTIVEFGQAEDQKSFIEGMFSVDYGSSLTLCLGLELEMKA